jgi:predicted permease
MSQLPALVVQVMLPVSLLVAAGAFWPQFFRDSSPDILRSQLNRLVMYVFYPSILFAVAAVTPVTTDLMLVPLLVGCASMVSGVILYGLLYRSPLGAGISRPARAALMLGGMIGNTFNIGVPVLVFFYGQDAIRYAVYNDMLMTMPIVWSVGVWIATRLGSNGIQAGKPQVLRVMLSMPPIWAFLAGMACQYSGLAYPPLVHAAQMIGQAAIPVILFVLGMTIPWRNLAPRREILVTTGVKLLLTPVIVWLIAGLFPGDRAEAQYAAVVEGSTPAMMTVLLIADRFRLDSAAAALLIGWSTILFWFTLPVLMTAGLIR